MKNSTEGKRQSLNWPHYVESFEVYDRFVERNFSEAVKAHRKRNAKKYVPIDQLHIAPENLLEPEPGYFAFYSDIIGFSVEVSLGGDSLRDFYGAAFHGAATHRNLKVFVLSDSCLAFCKEENCGELAHFTAHFVDGIQADGILHQTFIGHGSFVERRPGFDGCPSNFLGTQVSGTALVDAVKLEKRNPSPCGARILLSPFALERWRAPGRVVKLANGEIEYLPERGSQFDLHDCMYYFLCLRDQEPGSRQYDHYVWSLASRTVRMGHGFVEMAGREVFELLGAERMKVAVNELNEVLSIYADGETVIAEDEESNASS